MAAKPYERGAGVIVFWVITGAALVGALLMVLPFLSSILWATVLSVLTYPLYKRFKTRMSDGLAAFTTTTLAALIVIIPFAVIGTIVGVQVYDFASKLTARSSSGHLTVEVLAQEADKLAKPVLSLVGLGDVSVEGYVRENRDELADMVRGPLASGVGRLGATLGMMLIALLTMYFMLKDGHRLRDPVCEIVPLPRDKTMEILVKMESTVHAVFISVVMVSLVQAGIATLLYAATGVPSPWLWGLVTFIFCTVPLLGAPVIYAPLAIQLMATGKMTQGLILLVGCLALVSTIDNLVRPFFIGARSSLHPMAIFFSLLGGVVVFGPVGVMAGPLVLTLLIGLTDVLRATRESPVEALPELV